MGREGVNGKVNKKVLAVGAVTLAALAAMAMVYYSGAAKTTTVKVKQLVSVQVSSLNSVDMQAPSITADELIGTVTVTGYDPDDNLSTSNTVNYRLIIDVPILKKISADSWSNVRGISIAVYESGNLKGFLTPWTPTLVIDDSVTISGRTADKIYYLKFNGIAYDDLEFKLGVRASVELR